IERIDALKPMSVAKRLLPAACGDGIGKEHFGAGEIDAGARVGHRLEHSNCGPLRTAPANGTFTWVHPGRHCEDCGAGRSNSQGSECRPLGPWIASRRLAGARNDEGWPKTKVVLMARFRHLHPLAARSIATLRFSWSF